LAWWWARLPRKRTGAFFTIDAIEELLRDVGFSKVYCRNAGTNFQCVALK